ncbi:uncharacterized protein [Nicotiana sylvestris]|uniref:uncharacterized protein n=1 Tax=Nicotiana sylvestris TaxID=4096 RepID=UPI00388C7D6E
MGASINLMPLSLYKQLGLGAPKPTTVMLQLADRSIAYPEGVIEDVLLKIGKFIFPADFIILDFQADEKVPIILGRPLLDTGYAIIKVREGKMIMRVDNEEAVFNIYKAIQLPRQYEELSMISIMEIDEKLITPSVYLQDSIKKAIVLFESLEINDEVEEMKYTLNTTCTMAPRKRPASSSSSERPATANVDGQPRKSVDTRPFNSQKFVSAKAQDKFNKKEEKTIVLEQAMDANALAINCPNIANELRRRGLDIFFEELITANVMLGREYYANLPEHDNYNVTIRK